MGISNKDEPHRPVGRKEAKGVQGEAMAATLKTLRFEENETEYFGKVPKILEGNCRCKDK